MSLLYLVTFLSGFAALVYQMLWIRQLALVLGSTTASISTVVAAFMGGLALGSAFLGRWVDRRGRPLATYVALEVGIALSALLVMLAIPWLASAYPKLVAATSGENALLHGARFAAVFALLLVPTSLMGGTFPVLVKTMTRELESLGAKAGRLYAANTSGAVAGAFTAGIYLIGAVGVPATYAVAIAFNLVSAAGAWLLLSRPVPAGVRARGVAARKAGLAAGGTAAATPERSRRAVAIAIGISGAIALGYEIVWGRAFAILLGHSIYAFTFVLSTYLSGLALGGWLVAPVLDHMRRPAHAFAFGSLALAVLSGASLWILRFLPFLEYQAGVRPLTYVLQNLVCTAILLLPSTALLGALLPLAIKVCTRGLDVTGREVGALYAWNTLGAIAGSLATGFLLIPRAGTQAAFALLVAANVALALVVGVRVGWPRGWTVAGAALLALAGASLAASRGSPLFRDKAFARVQAHSKEPLELLYFAEDQVCSVGLVRSGRLKLLFANGTVMTHWGVETQWMAHLPLAFARDPKDVLVLCLGMGVTFKCAASYPVRVTAVELSPKVAEAYEVLHGPVPEGDDRIVVGDARNEVLVGGGRYDVITVDPPPPLYAAGTVNFHTREFYELCRDKLRPGGVLQVWLPMGITLEEFQVLAKTFVHVFPRTVAWTTPAKLGITGVYLLGFGPEVQVEKQALRARLLDPRAERSMRELTEIPLEELLPLPLMNGPELERFCGDAPVMDDDHPWLEFPLFRNAGRPGVPLAETLVKILEARAARSAELGTSSK